MGWIFIIGSVYECSAGMPCTHKRLIISMAYSVSGIYYYIAWFTDGKDILHINFLGNKRTHDSQISYGCQRT